MHWAGEDLVFGLSGSRSRNRRRQQPSHNAYDDTVWIQSENGFVLVSIVRMKALRGRNRIDGVDRAIGFVLQYHTLNCNTIDAVGGWQGLGVTTQPNVFCVLLG